MSPINNKILSEALTYDDVLLVPAYSQILPKDTSTVTKLTRNINLNIPLISAAMDTVSEYELAISTFQFQQNCQFSQDRLVSFPDSE